MSLTRRVGLTLVLHLVLALAALSPAAAATPAADAASVEFFETKVRPLLAARCYECHSADSGSAEGNLRLDTRGGWAAGGDLGPAVVPGDPEKSLLIKAVRYKGVELRMPPDGKLPDAEVAVLEAWVRRGAPDPREEAAAVGPRRIDLEAGRRFWSFRTPADPPVPAVRDAAWPATDVDRFVLAGLEAKGLAPAPPADRRTLVRRATFDLIGLPPTAGEVDAFLADPAPGAFDKVIDRLLASPRYGERWGRHWLDVARYADSNGLDENVAHGNAWRYRDYVIAAFNADKPYDRFVAEQLAGDLLPAAGEAARHEQLTATGFLALGPKVLAEVDKAKMEMDIVDEQIDTVGKAFLGLTLGCARCHDHKFDPIRTEDYYALAGVFKSTKTMESFKTIARWHENPIPTPDERRTGEAHAKLVAEKKASVGRLVEQASAAAQTASTPPAQSVAAPTPAAAEAAFPAAVKEKLAALRAELAKLEKEAPAVSSAMGVAEGTVADVPVHVRGSHLTLGKVVGRDVPAVLASSRRVTFPPTASGRLELSRWLTDPDHPLTGRVMVNRVWRWHFGRGLAGSTDNFGALGEPPANPALLDWLARRFVEDGWSVKAMHRRLMRSKTYQLGSRLDSASVAADPDNRLFGRAEARRLEAEAVRDSLLAVGGLLDLTAGGSLLHVKNREFFFDHTSKDGTRYDSRRRSVYLPVVRNNLYDVFSLFDATDAAVAAGDRATTTVAPQALFLLNADLVADAADGLASVALADGSLRDAGRVAALYRRAYARTATPAEVARALAFLRDFAAADGESSRRRAWQALAHALLAANEFVYVL